MNIPNVTTAKNIGVLFPSRESGGVFQFTISIAESLINYTDSKKFRYYIIHYATHNPKKDLDIKTDAVNFISIPQKSIAWPRKILHFLSLAIFNSSRLADNTSEAFKNITLDLLIYPTPFTYDFVRGIPSIAYLPNMMHRYYPRFPEFPFMARITRDIIYKYYAQKAAIYASDSKQGIEDIHKFLGVSLKKARVIPFIPAGYIYKYRGMTAEDIEVALKKYNLPEKFIFYPAQFWHHKNHLRLIQALQIIKKKYDTSVNLVLVGNAEGKYKEIAGKVFAEIKKLNLDSQITHLGYVPDKEMVALYKKSLALVNPSLLGPTGIPFVEAIVLGVPIIGPDIWEVPNIVGKAGVLFNPFHPEDMAEKIYLVSQDTDLRKGMMEEARLLAQNITPQNHAGQWQKVIEEVLATLPK